MIPQYNLKNPEGKAKEILYLSKDIVNDMDETTFESYFRYHLNRKLKEKNIFFRRAELLDFTTRLCKSLYNLKDKSYERITDYIDLLSLYIKVYAYELMDMIEYNIDEDDSIDVTVEDLIKMIDTCTDNPNE